MLGQSKMRFTGIWKQPNDCLDRCVGHGQSRRSMIETGEVDQIVSVGKLVIGKRESWIALDCLIQEINGFQQTLL